MKIKTIIPILTLLLIYACFKPEPECKKYVDEFFPIAQGNTWEYEKLFYSNGEIDSSWTDTQRFVIENAYQKTFADSSYLIGEGYWHGEFQGVVSDMIFNGQNGLYYTGIHYRDSIWFYEPQLYYKYPVNLGENWKVNVYSINLLIIDTLDISCVAKDHIYITPYDTFLTTVYHHSSKMADVSGYWHYFEYYCYGVGKVGVDVYSTGHASYNFNQRNIQNLFITSKLINYCLF